MPVTPPRRADVGIVCVHGLGGTPFSVGPLTHALHAAGYTATALLLPGHGTDPAHLASYTWDDWLRAVVHAANRLHAEHSQVVLVGQSMGATLALAAALELPYVVGVGAINAVVLPADPDTTEHLEYLLSRGRTLQPAGPPDIADPTAVDQSYGQTATTALLEMGRGCNELFPRLNSVDVPVFVVSSDQDSVIDPANSDALSQQISGSVTRLRLPRSAHVATLDFDRDLLCRELLTWLVNLTDPSARLSDESASS